MHQPAEPIAVRGYGCISALGQTVNELREGVLTARNGVGALDFDPLPSSHVSIAAQVKDFDPLAHFTKRELTTLDRFSTLALVAAEEAVQRSDIDPERLKGPRTAVIVGSGIGGQSTVDGAFEAVFEKGSGRLDPILVPKIMVNAAASNIGMTYGCTGPTLALSTACSSATQCIGLGFEMLRSGQVDLAIVGGAEAMVTPYSMRTWEALRVLTPDACRPFSRKRNGMVLGEGAGIFVLERAADVRARGEDVSLELVGYGTTSDAVDLLRPDPKGASRAMEIAIASAGIERKSIGYINAHGTGTLANDASETEAIKTVFGDHAYELSISSTKAMHGHAIGAAGAIELAVTLVALEEQVAPPTINWLERDPACDLDYVPNEPRPMSLSHAMSNSFAFGGINASLIARRSNQVGL